MHLKRYAKTFAEKEQAKKKRKAYDQDLQWNHYRRKNMEKKIFLPNLLCLVIEESLLRIGNQ
jgi:hypothetical protein